MDLGSFEETLCKLPNVDAVRVVNDDRGNITEVHVLAAPGKPAKQVVRDVQSLAMASFGINVDRRRVSVVQIESEDVGTGNRPSVVDVIERPIGAKTEVMVSLAWQAELYTGRATGPSGPTTRLRTIGEATLDALDEATGVDAAMALASLDIVTAGGRQVILATVVLVTGGEERLLIGSALSGSDPSRAAVRAVLDAVNRIVPTLRR